MAIKKGKIDGDINIGLYCSVNDTFGFIPQHRKFNVDIKEVLELENLYMISLYESPFIGIFMCMNSNGAVIPKSILPKEKERLREVLKKEDMNLLELQIKENVIGNLILCNDKGGVISHSLSKYKKSIEDTLGIEIEEGKIMELDIVGSLGYATNKGFVISVYATDEEYEHIKNVLKVDGDIASVNYGSPYVKSGIIANSKGLVVGENTTPIEMGRIAESLGFV